MFKDNLVQLRKINGLTQEELAEKIGVSRQAIAKWEAGETSPDLEKARLLAQTLDTSLDDLTKGDKGQIVIPAKARKIFDIKAGDQMIVLGEEGQGLAVMKTEGFLAMADVIRNKQ